MGNVKEFKVLMRLTYLVLFIAICVGFSFNGLLSLLENVIFWLLLGIILLILHIVLILISKDSPYFMMFTIAYMIGLGFGFIISNYIILIFIGIIILLFQILVVETR